MPRLLPADWIKRIAINYLLQLYEKENRFVQQWEEVKRPFIPLIDQMGKVSCLIEVEHMLTISPPHDLISWISDLQKLRNYLKRLPSSINDGEDISELQESCAGFQERLKPYVNELSDVAYKWNLRASWAGNELTWRDIYRAQQAIFNAAGVTILNKLSNQQIQKLIKEDSGPLPSDNWTAYINTASFYLSGGRQGYIKELNERLEEFERKLKASGAKEPPSAVPTHAEWWFDHYVHNMKFPDIANKNALTDDTGGRQPENIRKAVLRFSQLLSIEPIERT